MQNMATVRYVYNNRLVAKPDLAGRIDFRFAIDSKGHVLYVTATDCSATDSQLVADVVQKIYTWRFDAIDVPSDTLTVSYPFVFYLGNSMPDQYRSDCNKTDGTR